MTGDSGPFDRRAVRRNRTRAALRPGSDGEFLFREIGSRLLDRLDDVTRTFPVACQLAARDGHLRRELEQRNGTEVLIQADQVPAYAGSLEGPRLVADEEFLPFAHGSLDLVISNLSLHWVNDLPGALVQIRRALKPDGLFLASLLGNETLQELRSALSDAEIAATGGLSPRLSPMVDIRDAGALLQRAGFMLPVADVDRIDTSYPDAFALMRDLKAMGETNALVDRPRGLARRDVLMTAAALYAERFADRDGRVPATFDVLYLTAWSPAPSPPPDPANGSGEKG